jgi:hypothetical protein
MKIFDTTNVFNFIRSDRMKPLILVVLIALCAQGCTSTKVPDIDEFAAQQLGCKPDEIVQINVNTTKDLLTQVQHLLDGKVDIKQAKVKFYVNSNGAGMFYVIVEHDDPDGPSKCFAFTFDKNLKYMSKKETVIGHIY